MLAAQPLVLIKSYLLVDGGNLALEHVGLEHDGDVLARHAVLCVQDHQVQVLRLQKLVILISKTDKTIPIAFYLHKHVSNTSRIDILLHGYCTRFSCTLIK